MEKLRNVEREKLLKEIIDNVEKIKPEERIVPVQKLVLMRDGDANLRVPRQPITTPEQCLSIFRQIFKGARQEIVAVISLTKQMGFLNAAPVAWGSIDHVEVSRRQVFTEVLCRSNAAYFILGHNHPSGDPSPSTEDFAMLEDLRLYGRAMDCPMKDFVIVGDGSEKYYSHRELNFEFEVDV